MTRFNLSRWAIAHPALVRYLMVSLLVLGIGSYFSLGQDEDPPFHWRAMVVQMNWPGATATQMAEQVTDRIERILQDVPNGYKIASFAKPGHTTVIFQLADDFNPHEVPDRFYAARKKIGDAAHSFPQGVQGPYFNDDFGDTFGVMFALAAPGYSQAELTDFSRQVRNQLLSVKDVGKVEIFGQQQERVTIELARRELARYGLSSDEVARQITQQNAITDAGRLQSRPYEIPIRVEGQFVNLSALEQMPIRAGGTVLRLSDIAQVRRTLVDPPTHKVRFNGQEVVVLGVSMRKGGNIIALGESLEAQIPRMLEGLPVGVQLERVQDQPKVVSNSVQEFLKVLAEAVAIVLGVSLIALGLHRQPLRLDPRPGLIVAISIPLVLAVTFLVMNLWGVGIHKISLGSLIIALGLLVDDAIIVVEMMVRKLEEGASRLEAATAAYDLTAIPMLTGTLITAVGFLPIGIAKSAVGEYTFAIFAVTAAALLVSWLVSVIFVPSLGYWLLRAPKAGLGHAEDDQFEGGFYKAFRRVLTACVRRPVLVLVLTVLTFVAGVVGMGKVEKQFFPDSSRPEILVDIYLAEGTSMVETEAVAKRLEAVALSVDGVATVTNWIGSGAPRFFMPLDVIFPQSNVTQMIILPKPGADRKRIVAVLSEQLPRVAPEARIRAKLLPNGPPVPYPVQVRVISDHIEPILKAQPQIEAVMRQHPDLLGLHSNWNQSRPVARVDLDLARARELGVASSVVAQTLRARFSGVLVGEFRDDDKLLPIEMRLPPSERDQLTDLRELLLVSQSGALVPLEKIASVSLQWEPGIIWRKDRQFAMTLQGTVRAGRQGPSVQAEIMANLKPILNGLPQGVEIEVGGETEESGRGQASIFKGLPIMLFITFTLLVLQLQSTPRSLMVLATAPLGIAGVAGALLMLNRPFGFVAMLGVIALMGMIMRNSVILIDQIERERASGRPIREAIVEATVRRFRPITLTAAAAVLAMIPLQGSIFWGPMAVAIMGGLIVATLLTLLSLPALYALFVRERG
ncbi:MAG: hypothetical protein RLY30_902 [Pseudomonadota bacterium]|jgi:multidrug efflux pump subunit AcrB